MITRQHIEPLFFDRAEEMRQNLDALFDRPYDSPLLWKYFSVPQIYTYLIASTTRSTFGDELVDAFQQRLETWCFDNLGLVPRDPLTHLMVNGCSINLHSDFHNGAFGYVFSLTRWDQRTFDGGETLLMRDGVPSYKKHHVHGEHLYELFPANFNQLLVFDDRIVHSVPAIQGSMNPKEGRIAMVGHIRATGPRATGALRGPSVRETVYQMLPQIAERLRPFKDVNGTMTYRLRVVKSGAVESVTTLTNNLITQATGYGPSEGVKAAKAVIHEMLMRLRFAESDGNSEVTLAVLAPVPDMRRIEVSAKIKADAFRPAVERLDRILKGRWSDGVYVVDNPLDGTISMTSGTITASLDPPMWVPSQRAQLEGDIARAFSTFAE